MNANFQLPGYASSLQFEQIDNDNSLLLELRELAVTCDDMDKSETSSGTRAMDKKVSILQCFYKKHLALMKR